MTAEGRPYADTTPPRLWLLGMSVAVLLALAVLAHSFETQTLDLFMLRLDFGSAVLAWIGLMVVVAICMLAVLIRLYHVRHNHDSRVAGGLVLLTGIVLVFHATHLASLVISAKDIQAAYVAADEQDNAGVFALSNGRLQVIGPVGNSLFSDILALDDPQSPVKVIEIASEGGLIDVALQLARFVEDRRISVVVTNICLSACVLIAVASAELGRRGSDFWIPSGFTTCRTPNRNRQELGDRNQCHLECIFEGPWGAG